MNPTVALTIASLKMYFRNRQALFFSIAVPFIIMGIFGILNFDAFSDIDLGVVDEAGNGVSNDLVEVLERTEVLDLQFGTRDEQVRELENGELDFLVILPEEFGQTDGPSVVEGLFNANRPQESQVATAVLSRALDDLTFDVIGSSRLFELRPREVASRSFEYVDFLVPGIIAMSIMQGGLFGVTFSVIQFRKQGVLRRLKAAPIHPGHFLVGQVVTRLTVSVIQTVILVAAGILIFGIDVRGSFATLLILSIIGGGLFVSMGYAVSGFARSEESAVPIANLIALPMMFLSGVFFSRDNLPGFFESVTDYFPLTYLADGLRQVTTEGSGLAQIPGDLLGLGVWLAASFFVATRVFRWE